jgi:hypothetical protein
MLPLPWGDWMIVCLKNVQILFINLNQLTMVFDFHDNLKMHSATIDALNFCNCPYTVLDVPCHIIVSDEVFTPVMAWNIGAYTAMVMEGRTVDSLPPFPFSVK